MIHIFYLLTNCGRSLMTPFYTPFNYIYLTKVSWFNTLVLFRKYLVIYGVHTGNSIIKLILFLLWDVSMGTKFTFDLGHATPSKCFHFVGLFTHVLLKYMTVKCHFIFYWSTSWAQPMDLFFIGPHQANIDSGNDLVPSGNHLLPKHYWPWSVSPYVIIRAPELNTPDRVI